MGNIDDLMVFDDEDEITGAETSAPVADSYDTENYLKGFFNKCKKIGKDGLVIYENRNTFLGKKINASDKVIEFALINGESSDSSFMTISFKLLIEKEIKEISKIYTSIGVDRRYPMLVDKKYMSGKKYKANRMKILEQFS